MTFSTILYVLFNKDVNQGPFHNWLKNLNCGQGLRHNDW